jgi:hypothetical protein
MLDVSVGEPIKYSVNACGSFYSIPHFFYRYVAAGQMHPYICTEAAEFEDRFTGFAQYLKCKRREL